MERPKVGRYEKTLVRATFRTLQRINPLTYVYEKIITEKIKECSNEHYIVSDGHVHDFFSDGDSSPDHMVDVAYRRGIKIGLGGNHDTTIHWDYYKEAEEKYPDFVYIPGIEISTTEGDILAHFPSYDCKNHPAVKYLVSGIKLSAEETIDKIHEAGGIAIAPHPNKNRGIGLRKLGKLKDKLDAVEEINIGAGERNILGRTFSLPSVGNSDAHSKINVGSAVSKLDKEYFKDCYENGKVDRVKFRGKYIDLVRNEKLLINVAHISSIIPYDTVKSSFEENIEKTTYWNPFLDILRFTEYFIDKNKLVARRLEACLKK